MPLQASLGLLLHTQSPVHEKRGRHLVSFTVLDLKRIVFEFNRLKDRKPTFGGGLGTFEGRLGGFWGSSGGPGVISNGLLLVLGGRDTG